MKNKDLTIVLSDKQAEQVKKAVKSAKSLYQNFKALLETDIVIREMFLTKTCKEIVVIVYGDEALTTPEFALTENRNRTAFGNALHNLKKFAKSQYRDVANNEKPTHKKAVTVCNDLDLIAQNWHLYDMSEQNSIAHHLEKLIKAIKIK